MFLCRAGSSLLHSLSPGEGFCQCVPVPFVYPLVHLFTHHIFFFFSIFYVLRTGLILLVEALRKDI